MLKTLRILVVLLALTAVGIFGRHYWHSLYHGPSMVPALTLTATDGSQINLQSMRGKPLLLNFWAPSCHDCLKEIPDLKTLQSEYQAKGFTVIAIAVPWDPPPAVLEIMTRKQFNFPVAIDLTNEAQRAFGGVESVPTSFLIAPDGRLVKRIVDRVDMDALRKQLNDWLGS
ncbi:MAG: TlpA disulfide reductase family protein [Gammaproteobacteria bacterium]